MAPVAVVALGAATGVGVGLIAACVITASVGALYQKAVPLEWRERIDETFWHLPYHLGLANW